MRATINAAIRKLRDMLNRLTLEESCSHINFVPLNKHSPKSFKGIEVKFVSASDDHAMIVEDIGFLRVRVRTFGRLACRDTVPRIDKVQAVVPESQARYSDFICQNIKCLGSLSHIISEFCYFKLIPVELHILGSDTPITYTPHKFPIVWQIYTILEMVVPDWEQRYFHSWQFHRTLNRDLMSIPALSSLDDEYYKCMVNGKKSFPFMLFKEENLKRERECAMNSNTPPDNPRTSQSTTV